MSTTPGFTPRSSNNRGKDFFGTLTMGVGRSVRERSGDAHGDLFDHRNELREEIVAVMRPGRGFGMVLHAKDGKRTMSESLNRPVVEVDVCEFYVRLVHRFPIDGEPVIL